MNGELVSPEELPDLTCDATDLVPLPDGITPADITRMDFDKLSREHPEEAAILSDLAVKSHQANTRRLWVFTAQLLYIVEQRELWRYHPAGFNSFAEWAMQPEIDISPSVRSDMFALAHHAPVLADHGIDIWALIEEVGSAKVRHIVPTIREAVRDDLVDELVVPLVEQIKGATFREVLELVSPKAHRMNWQPAAIYEENDDGTYTLTLAGLEYEQLELAAKKLGLVQWFDKAGKQIPNPLALEQETGT